MEKTLESEFVGKFVGPNKIVSIEITEVILPSSARVFELTYENGYKELFPEKGLVIVISDEAKDFNHIRDARVDVMVPEILGIIKEYDIPFDQFTHLMTKVAFQLQQHFNRANAILWHGDAKTYVPGVDTMGSLTLLEAERVNLREKPNEDAG